jgi:hypothetical protein
MGPFYASENKNLSFKDWEFGKKRRYNFQISRTKRWFKSQAKFFIN